MVSSAKETRPDGLVTKQAPSTLPPETHHQTKPPFVGWVSLDPITHIIGGWNSMGKEEAGVVCGVEYYLHTKRSNI